MSKNAPKVIGCAIQCRCGGTVNRLVDNVAYVLTEDHRIIFAGICDTCGNDVSVSRDILSLMVICPMKEGERGN